MLKAIGYLAGTLTTLAFVPQVVRSWRTRSTGDLSTGMLITFSAGVALWFIYGLGLRAWPIVVANGVTLALALVLVGFKLASGAGRGGAS
jgi:MtN3 and saliva related transmembrane protein